MVVTAGAAAGRLTTPQEGGQAIDTLAERRSVNQHAKAPNALLQWHADRRQLATDVAADIRQLGAAHPPGAVARVLDGEDALLVSAYALEFAESEARQDVLDGAADVERSANTARDYLRRGHAHALIAYSRIKSAQSRGRTDESLVRVRVRSELRRETAELAGRNAIEGAAAPVRSPADRCPLADVHALDVPRTATAGSTSQAVPGLADQDSAP